MAAAAAPALPAATSRTPADPPPRATPRQPCHRTRTPTTCTGAARVPPEGQPASEDGTTPTGKTIDTPRHIILIHAFFVLTGPAPTTVAYRRCRCDSSELVDCNNKMRYLPQRAVLLLGQFASGSHFPSSGPGTPLQVWRLRWTIDRDRMIKVFLVECRTRPIRVSPSGTGYHIDFTIVLWTNRPSQYLRPHHIHASVVSHILTTLCCSPPASVVRIQV